MPTEQHHVARDGIPKTAFNNLLASIGTWKGQNRVQISGSEPAHESPFEIIDMPMLLDTFIRIDPTCKKTAA